MMIVWISVATGVLVLAFVLLRKKSGARGCPQCGRALRVEWPKCPFCNWEPMPRLEFLSGPSKGQTANLTTPQITIGSVDGNTILLSDPAVSRHHFEIRRINGFFEMMDLHSTNGVYVNGRRLMHARLKRGDVVRCGNSEMRFWDE